MTCWADLFQGEDAKPVYVINVPPQNSAAAADVSNTACSQLSVNDETSLVMQHLSNDVADISISAR